METTITISREEVMQALSRTTTYIGAKQPDSTAQSCERIALNPGDTALMERFWQECREPLLQTLRHRLTGESLQGNQYTLSLNLSEAIDPGMHAGLQEAVTNYFVYAIGARWLAITDRTASADFTAAAREALDAIARQVCCKRAPRRPRY